MDSAEAQGFGLPYSGVVMEVKTLSYLPVWVVEMVERFQLRKVGNCKYSTAIWRESAFRGYPVVSAAIAVAIVADDKKAQYQSEVERYKKEKAEIKDVADKLEAEAKDWDAQSDAQMHLHHRWAQATTALQIAIALAAMALLTRRRWLEWGMFGVAAVGVALGGAALLHI